MIRASHIGLLVLAAVILAGCSPGSGVPRPSSGASSSATTSTASSAVPYAGAPKVANPLPVSTLSGDPCADGLTADQTKTVFGQVESGQRKDDPVLGSNCEWSNPDTGALLSVTYDSTHDGLSSVYRGNKPRAIVWHETSIQGFPAAAHLTNLSGPKDTFCVVSVGIADSASVDIGLTLSRAKVGKSDPCAVNTQIADMVIGNLRQKAGS
ncbi:DUF3558 domain-containing protein [Amycolatopsis rhizosphaerae]|uniref:DUF3558 domain-containing protein n=1 Tax=Amycolatopsis rhizosphaerae TaxID=2053003 RepID=A0A558DLQ6_9PSEU|nr:DUF3558 domain-containing protein [Amycolatopsis rhizosphaerae]TVT61904.1 DUF3558 domain-containing protein [Amycolatopsis rhizosphaerae]